MLARKVTATNAELIIVFNKGVMRRRGACPAPALQEFPYVNAHRIIVINLFLYSAHPGSRVALRTRSGSQSGRLLFGQLKR